MIEALKQHIARSPNAEFRLLFGDEKIGQTAKVAACDEVGVVYYASSEGPPSYAPWSSIRALHAVSRG